MISTHHPIVHRRAIIPLAIAMLCLGMGLSRDAAGQNVPPELAALDAQYSKLQRERVTTPYETELKKLNDGYQGLVYETLKKELSFGRVEGQQAFGEELKRLQNKQPVPETDTPGTPRALVNLRITYRATKSRLDTKRAADLKVITEPLARRLTQMAADFTRTGRVVDAKAVEEYRQALGQLLGTSGPAPTNTAPTNVAATAVSAMGHTNSLGMKFLVVADTTVMFCIHEVRRKDYAAYANVTAGVDASWMSQQLEGLPCGDKDDHPVVGVNWEDAQAFCAWLSKKEGRNYRLPTDREWSIAAGVGSAEVVTEDTTPEMLNTGGMGRGADYPPNNNSKDGNYADSAWHGSFPKRIWINGYTDAYVTTAPVMSFRANALGLHDIKGNAWEWVEDWFNDDKKLRVLRGSTYAMAGAYNLNLVTRFRKTPKQRDNYTGFRVVMARQGGVVTALPIVPAPSPIPPPVGTAVKIPLVAAAPVIPEDRNIERALEDVIFPDWQTQSISTRWDFLPTLQVRSDDPELSQHVEALFSRLCQESGLKPEAGERNIDVYIGRSEKLRDLVAREDIKTRSESTCLVYWDERHALKRSVVFLSTNNFATKESAKARLSHFMMSAFGLQGLTRELKVEDQSIFSQQSAGVQTISAFDCKLLTFVYQNIPAGTTKPDARRIIRKEWKP